MKICIRDAVTFQCLDIVDVGIFGWFSTVDVSLGVYACCKL